MSFETRIYQQEGIDTAISQLEQGIYALLQLPTGAGKAYMIAEIVRQLIAKYGLKIAVLVEQKNLVQQLAETIEAVAGIQPGIVCAGIGQPDWSRQITVGTRQTAISCLPSAPIHLLIADEAHAWKLQKTGEQPSGQFAQIFSCLKGVNPQIMLLGFTATPYTLAHGYIYGRNNKDGYEPYFDNLSYRVTYKELFDNDYLCIPELYIVDKIYQPDLSGVSFVGQEYHKGQLSRAMCRYTDNLLPAIGTHAEGCRHVLVFCVDISHVDEVCKAIPGAVPIHSELPSETQHLNMSMFKSGLARYCASVDQLSVGFDFRAADCAVLARPSNSPGLVLQQVGRILRKSEGKTRTVIIDAVGNLEKHLVDLDFDSPIVKVPRASKKTGEVPVKSCPGKDGIICSSTRLHAAVKVCPTCGYTFTDESIIELIPTFKKVVPYEKQPPKEMVVDSMETWEHTSKKTGKRMLCIQFSNGGIFTQQTVRIYLMFADFYEGFAVRNSKKTWEQLTDEPFPETVEEAVFLSETFRQPLRLEYVKKDGFDNVSELFFEEKEEEKMQPVISRDYNMGADVPF